MLPNASLAPPSARAMAAYEPDSMGSPSAVPVPCASVHTDRPAFSPASAWAASRRACCAWPFGAVMLAERPS
eukprot:5101637-Prymnesium_polylepis.1